jgi:hypothetical protein
METIQIMVAYESVHYGYDDLDVETIHISGVLCFNCSKLLPLSLVVVMIPKLLHYTAAGWQQLATHLIHLCIFVSTI